MTDPAPPTLDADASDALPDWPVLIHVALPSQSATNALAARMAGALRPGDTLLLSGALGAGKTHLARALIRARLGPAGAAEEIPSPSFTLVQTYETPGAEIWHADLYRLTHPDEILELGLDQALQDAICLIEWPERFAPDWPAEAVLLRLSMHPDLGDEARQIDLSAPPGSSLGARLAPLFGATG